MLVAPLNWGLGHATRCIPIINGLIASGFEPVLASDGNALKLLQKEFPQLSFFKLPSYNISYSKKGNYLKTKLLLNLPFVIKAVINEKKIINKLIENEEIAGLISDNRFGVYSKKIPSVYITHQVQVLSGLTTFLTSKIHELVINKFDECWVPDFEKEPSFSGKLGHKKNKLSINYIGILSRLTLKKVPIKYHLTIVLSGPEPQRTLLEKNLFEELKNYKKKVLFIRGVLSKKESQLTLNNNIKVINYLKSHDLETVLNESNSIIARSGYSTIMDLAALGKKAFFIPTPGQYEQEYLAALLNEKQIAPFSTQDKFSINKLKELERYSGFKPIVSNLNLEIFGLFKSK